MRPETPISPVSSCRFFLFFSILLLICYSNTFSASWQMDDRPNILHNSRIHMSDISIEEIWKSMTAKPGSGGFYRPIACFSFALNWFAGQDSVAGYHVVNWFIHFGTSWLLFLTIQLFFHTPTLKDQYSTREIYFVSALATMLWALNPLQTQAVTYIVQRMASLSAFFSLLSIFCYIKGRINTVTKNRNILFFIGAICYIFAILSKENSIIILLIIPIIEYLFFNEKTFTMLTKRKIISFLFLIFIIIFSALAIDPGAFNFLIKYYDHRPFSMLERVLTEQRILLFYITQLIYPHPSRLSIAHDFTLSTSIINPIETIVAIAVNITLIMLAIIYGKRYPFFGLAILFYYTNHIIESTIAPLELVFEHRNYLPSLFFFIPISLLLNSLVKFSESRKILLIVTVIAISSLLTSEGYATYIRNNAWKTEQSLWLDALYKAPNSDRPLAVLALQIGWRDRATERDFNKALDLIKRTLSMTKNRKMSDAAQLGNAASLYHKLGNYQMAISYYEQALKITPNDPSLTFNMAKTLLTMGKIAVAQNAVRSIIARGNTHSDYYHLIGFCDLWLNNTDSAIINFRKALTMAPNRPDILLALGRSLSLSGHHDRARWFLDMAREKGGENPIVSLCLIENCLLQNNAKLAKAYLAHALQHHTIPSLLTTMTELKNMYSSVPIDKTILQPFITEEIINYTSTKQ